MTMGEFSINFLSDWKRPLRYSGFTVFGLDFDWGFSEVVTWAARPWASMTFRFIGFHLDVTYWPKGKCA